MTLDLKALKKTFAQTDKIIMPEYTKWMTKHADDPLPPEVLDVVRDLLSSEQRERSGSFSSSSASKCERAQVLAYLGMPQTITPDAQLANIFLDGKWRHLRWQAVLLAMGLLIEVEYSLSWPAWKSIGTMDGLGVVPDSHPVWAGKEFGFELKGVSTFQFAAASRAASPYPEHVAQVARYFLSGGFELFSVVYEDKTTQAIHEWVLEADSDLMREAMDEQDEELTRLNEAVDTKQLPQMLPECANLRGNTFNDCWFGGKYGSCAKHRNDKWPRVKG